MLKLNFKASWANKSFAGPALRKHLIIICLFLFSIVAMANQNFYISNYGLNIKIDEKNKYEVSEKIDTVFTKPQRGIIRAIPSRYGSRNLDITDIVVSGDPFSKKVFNTSTNLRIGSANKFITGNKTYNISYKYDLGDDGYPNYDEVYFNIIGNEWDTNIDRVNFVIELPKSFDKSKINFTMGQYGSISKGSVTYEVQENKIIGYTTKRLRPGDALTIALPLPQGYFKVQSYALLLDILDKFIYAMIFALPILSLVLWFLFGKNKQLVETVEFYPPDGMNPTEVGYYIDGRVDARDITSLFVYWADKGYLDIVEEDKKSIFSKVDYIFEKKKDIEAKNSYEPYLFNSLFAFAYSGNSVYVSSLKDKFFKCISKTVDLFRIDLAMNRTRLYTKESIFMKQVVSCFPFILLILAAIRFSFQYRVRVFSPEILGVIPYIFMKYPAILPAVFFIIIVASKIKRRTEEYSQLLGRLKGFKRFLTTAEKEKLEMLVDENPSYFYNILPYTIVLKVSDKWAGKFNDILTSPPDWYHSTNMGTFSALYFMGSLNRSMNNISSNMYSRPGSNNGPGLSSMGGGSAGGGAGGGGGSSW